MSLWTWVWLAVMALSVIPLMVYSQLTADDRSEEVWPSLGPGEWPKR